MLDARRLKIALSVCAKAGITPLVWGEHGIGKSQIVTELAHELYGERNDPTTEHPNGFPTIINLRLGQMEVGDLIGNPRNENVGGKTKTIYGMPGWFPPEGTKGILFLDEINRAGTLDVLQAIFQLVLDKRLHTHKLPKDWVVMAAANPPDGNYQVQVLDDALTSRFVHLFYVPTEQDWLTWAGTHIAETDIKGFAAVQPGCLGLPKDAYKMQINKDPRCWEFFDKICRAMTSEEREIVGSVLLAGLVGSAIAVAYEKYARENYEKPVEAMDVFNSYPKVKDKIKHYSDQANVRMDVLKATAMGIISKMTEMVTQKDPKTLTKPQLDNFADFLCDIPVDLAFSTLFEIKETDIPELEELFIKMSPYTKLQTRLLSGRDGKKLEEGRISLKQEPKKAKAKTAKDAEDDTKDAAEPADKDVDTGKGIATGKKAKKK